MLTMCNSVVFFFFFFFLNLEILVNNAFSEPALIYLTNNSNYVLSMESCQFIIEGVVNMTTRCFCLNDNCGVPGPTLVMQNGSVYHFTVKNNLYGSNHSMLYSGRYQNPDVINLHTHGLHISPIEDSQFIHINPQSSYEYNLTILSSHYPGIHWYHTHAHGSSSFQLHGGAFGTILIKYNNENNILDSNLLNMKDHVIAFHFMHLHNNSYCNCSDSTTLMSLPYQSGEFAIFPYCFEWCIMPPEQRQSSGIQYNVQGVNNEKFFLVNGQINPIINDMKVDEYRIFRMLGALSQHYVQLKFSNSTSCEYYMIAKDGVYLKNHRNLCLSPYYCYLLIPAGGRVDVAIKCNKEGIYEIKSSTDNIYSYLSKFPRFDDNIVLFTLNITSNNTDNNNNNYIKELPLSYPTYPTYLKSMLDEDNELILEYPFYKTCDCITYNSSALLPPLNTNNTCGYQFGGQDGSTINAEQFNESKPLSYVLSNAIYEWYIEARIHPFHQHVNPFQAVDDIGNGFIAQKGDIHDTVGSYYNYTIRALTLDFTGNILAHCHFLPHQDMGMMAYYVIVDEYPSTCPTPIPTTFPTLSSTTIPSYYPTKTPTLSPTILYPTLSPTILYPTLSPTILYPKLNPTTLNPTLSPTTLSPTLIPTTLNPTLNPTTLSPTAKPITPSPTAKPTTASPTAKPTTSQPTVKPTTSSPTAKPTTSQPTAKPTTLNPTSKPTTAQPTAKPTTLSPTSKPTTAQPTAKPTTAQPTSKPTPKPTAKPTTKPTPKPISRPTFRFTRR